MNIDLEHIRNHFKKDRFATENGVMIDSVREDCVVCSMELNADHKNSVGGVQGGAIFTLADLAFAVHCNLAWLCGEDVGVTLGQSCSISFLKSSKGKRLTAKSTCLSKGRSMSIYRICVVDDLEVPIAEMLANGFTLNKGTRA
ncbi:MAG: PaaI family thioesterase [Burkholderiales bacterium]|jgi:acyl-CoA thioesterase|nr:PaaI family thioesterase [Burkholderiales bacterium]